MSSKAEARNIYYSREEIYSPDVYDVIRDTCGLGEGDLSKLVLDGKVIPVVSVNGGAYSLLREVEVAGATVDIPMAHVRKYVDDYNWYFSGEVSVAFVTAEATDWSIYWQYNGLRDYHIKTEANTNPFHKFTLGSWNWGIVDLRIENHNAAVRRYMLSLNGSLYSQNLYPDWEES